MNYNADEIYQIGVEIEKNGEAFYLAAVEHIEDDDAKQLFTELAAWEKTHIDLFANLKKQLPSNLKDDPDFDFDNQKQAYLKAAADSHIFMINKDIMLLVKDCESAADVLHLALQFEKDSVVLYSSMKALVPESLGKSTVDKLIDEEITHVAMLQQKLEVFSDS